MVRNLTTLCVRGQGRGDIGEETLGHVTVVVLHWKHEDPMLGAPSGRCRCLDDTKHNVLKPGTGIPPPGALMGPTTFCLKSITMTTVPSKPPLHHALCGKLPEGPSALRLLAT